MAMAKDRISARFGVKVSTLDMGLLKEKVIE